MAAVVDALQAAVDLLKTAPMTTVEADILIRSPFGLEANAARFVIKRGLLVTAKIGRSRYAKRSDLLKLIDVLHAEEIARRKPRLTGEDEHSQYLRAIGKAPR